MNKAGPQVARTTLMMAYHIICDGTRFVERGATFFDQLNAQSTQQWFTRRLERLGFEVTLAPIEVAAA